MDTDTGKIYTEKEMKRELVASGGLVERASPGARDVFDSDVIGQFQEDWPNMTPLKRLPKKKCKKCYGVGHRGRDTITNKFVPCVCTQ